MKYKTILFFIAFILVIGTFVMCNYYDFNTSDCAICQEKFQHFITAPMCEGNLADKYEWMDSIRIQGQRAGQVWICEIR